MNKTENFIPTKEQLEKLAKVAEVNVKYDKISRNYEYFSKGPKIWRPHLDRNQIAMIIKGLTHEQKDIFYDKLLRLYVKIHKNALEKQFTLWVMLLDPSISCKFLCEVIG